MWIRSGAALATCLFAIALSAQTRPDFAGRWIAVEPAAAAGHEIRITRDAQALTLEQVRLGSQPDDKARESTTYRLDGQPTITRLADNEAMQVRSTLIWSDDGRARLVDVYPANHFRFERRLSLDPKGRLILEQRLPELSSDDLATSSTEIAKPRRIIYERR